MLDLVLFPLVTPRRAVHGGECVTCGYGMRLADGFAIEENDPLLAAFGVGVSCVDDTGFEDALQDDAFAPGRPVLLLESVDGDADEVSVWSADGVRLGGVVHGDHGAQLAAALEVGAALAAHVVSEECSVHDGVRRGISVVAGPATSLAVTVEDGPVLRPARTERLRLVLIADGSGDVDLWDPSGRQGPVRSTAELPLSPELRARLTALQQALAGSRAGEEVTVGVDRILETWEAEELAAEALLVWRRLRAELGRRCEIGFLGRNMERPIWDPSEAPADPDDDDEY